MEVCFFGRKGRDVPRTTILKKGLKLENVGVRECYSDGKLFLRQFKLFIKYAFCRDKPEFIFIGYYGYPEVPSAWFLSRIFRKKLIFDPYVSNYDTFVLDRKLIKKGSIKSKFWHFVDKLCMNLPDLVLVDTKQNKKWYHEEFNVPLSKMKVLYVGADEDFFSPRKVKRRKVFNVLFYGTFIPLHGIEFIIKAAKKLEKEDVSFKIIGRGQTYDEIMKLVNKLEVKNVKFVDWVDYKKLPNEIAKADVCLGGPFGVSDKAGRVITNKTFQALAVGCPVIIGGSPAANYEFKNKEEVLFCKRGDPDSLAEAILLLKRNKRLREKIAKKGHALFVEKFSTKSISEELKKCLIKLLKKANY